jgi:hypothetical protein
MMSAALAIVAAALSAQTLTVNPRKLTLQPGERATLRISDIPSQVEATDPNAILTVAPDGRVSVQAPQYATSVSILIRCRDEFLVVPLVVQNAKEPRDSRLVVGLAQSGASSAEAVIRYFFDFFVNRPLTDNRRFNLWGNVRVASAPQQVDIPVAQFIPDLAHNLSKIEVNKLAHTAEFQTGFEIRLQQNPRRTLGLVAFFGSSAALSDPMARARIFKVEPNRYLGLVPQDRERFYRSYGAGIRHSSESTGMFTATVGQDQAITGGRYHRPVVRFDAVYPLQCKQYSLYLFAAASLAVARPAAANAPPFAYEPAPEIPLYDSRVKLQTVASARDSYRLGVGIDLFDLFRNKSNSR